MEVFITPPASAPTGSANLSNSPTSIPNAATSAPSMDGVETASAGETSAAHPRPSRIGASW